MQGSISAEEASGAVHAKEKIKSFEDSRKNQFGDFDHYGMRFGYF